MQPLTGVTVVTLAGNLPGPLAAANLAARGARVVKVEPPQGDPFERLAPAWYAELAAGQQVLRLDLKDAAGRARLDELLADADLLLTSHRPSALARLGIRDSLVRTGTGHVEIVGHDGDDEELAGHDLTYQAAHGTLDPPRMPRVLTADLIGGERATTAALAVLRRREQGEPAAHERVVLDDAARLAGAPARHGLTTADGILGGSLPEYRLYEAADGWLAVAALEPHFARRLFEHVAPAGELAATLRARPRAHWLAVAQEHDIPVAQVGGPPEG